MTPATAAASLAAKQEAARRAMNRFVERHGGDLSDIRLSDHNPLRPEQELAGCYLWTAPDGREAAIGWEASPAEAAAMEEG